LGEISTVGGADEALRAVQHELIAIEGGSRGHAGWIAAGAGLSLGKTGALLAAQDRIEEAFALLLVEAVEDGSWLWA
jgi:hypothetical protein